MIKLNCKTCNNVFELYPSRLKRNASFCSKKCYWQNLKTRKLSDKHKENISKSMKEIVKSGKHNFWKGGISRGYKTGYGTLRYKKWRDDVFRRDNYTCQDCGFHGSNGYITAHHIQSWAYFPELRFELDNGKTLCEDCHSQTDNYKGRAVRKEYARG